MTTRALLTMLACTAALAVVAVGCGGDDDSSSSGDLITADGSSTVGPFATKAAEDWKASGGSEVTVGISGTGGGFERFCVGETDISNASRQIDEDEAAICEENGIEYVELRVATDALTNVVNLENDWASCLTVEQLNAIWKPKSTVTNWNQVDPSYPDQPLKLYGAGTDSGTFDYFTDVINGEEGASRTDFSATEDDNVTVQGVSGDKGALGYFGFSYFEENQDKLKALEVDAGCWMRCAERRGGAERYVHPPLAAALHVREAQLAHGQRVGLGLHDLHARQRGNDRNGSAVRPAQSGADRRAAAESRGRNRVDDHGRRHRRAAGGDRSPPQEDPLGRAGRLRGAVHRGGDLRAHDRRDRPVARPAGARLLPGGQSGRLLHRDDVGATLPRCAVRRAPARRRNADDLVLVGARRVPAGSRRGDLPERVREAARDRRS